MINAPGVVVWLIAILAIAHAARVYAPSDLGERLLIDYAFIPARYSHGFLATYGFGPGNAVQRLLPFVTYVFLHADIWHLGINCLGLLAFGPIVARRFGSAAFLVLFFLCAILGALAHLAGNWASVSPVIGASGAISGLMAAGFRIYQGHPTPAGIGFELAPIRSRPVLIFSAVWVAVNVLAGLTGLGAGPQLRLIAWQVHLGGYFAGLLLAGPFDRLAWRRLERFRL